MSDDDDFQIPAYAFLPLPKTSGCDAPSREFSSSVSIQCQSFLKAPDSQTPRRPSKRFKHSINPGNVNQSLQQSHYSPPSINQISDKLAFDEPFPLSSTVLSRPISPEYVVSERVCSSMDEESGTICPFGSSPADICAGKSDNDELCDSLGGRVSWPNFSIESRLLGSRLNHPDRICDDDRCIDDGSENFENGTQLDDLLNLCCNESPQDVSADDVCCLSEENSLQVALVYCPLCELDISGMSDEQRLFHTNDCLDKEESSKVVYPRDIKGQVDASSSVQSSGHVVDAFPVIEWLRSLGLGRYEGMFTQAEIDWDTLSLLTEEDLLSIGITALGPRKKILHALDDLKKGNSNIVDTVDTTRFRVKEASKVVGNKLITEFFASSLTSGNKSCNAPKLIPGGKIQVNSAHKLSENHTKNKMRRDIPVWCCVPGTPFRVDAFRYLSSDCSHWFLSHFHMDHYQGLTKSFCHGKIYCSLITARLTNMKLGIPWEKMHVLPLNQKITVAGIDLMCVDANHCPGSIIILFEPPNGKAVLHTGDFRFGEGMKGISSLPKHPIHTLILDTTYCNPQFDFPKQESVIQFVIEAIQAEAFNKKTLFLIGSYTIGKERVFLEVARVLREKVYVSSSKMRILRCLELPYDDMNRLTSNEHESRIHVVSMWTIANFKRLKHVANQYKNRYNLIVAFSPTGWAFGKGKKSCGRKWQQGTIIRYEVPYSEHSSFTELKEFVKIVSAANIIPSVNNKGPESSRAMRALLSSQSV